MSMSDGVASVDTRLFAVEFADPRSSDCTVACCIAPDGTMVFVGPEMQARVIAEAANDSIKTAWRTGFKQGEASAADALDAERKARREAEEDARTLAGWMMAKAGKRIGFLPAVIEVAHRSLARAAGEGKA